VNAVITISGRRPRCADKFVFASRIQCGYSANHRECAASSRFGDEIGDDDFGAGIGKLFVNGAGSGSENELLEIWIIADRIPDRIDLQTPMKRLHGQGL